MQDAARLHLKWNEFVRLYAVSPAQIDTLNKAAPGFFFLVSEAWWDGIILHILWMTDGNKKLRHGSPTTYATPISDTATGRLPYG